jgi:surface polysaccharide O-acyltransferase-like enzyme
MNNLLIVLFALGIIILGFIIIKLARKRQFAYLPALVFLSISFLFLALGQLPQQGGGFGDIIYILFGVFMIFASVLSALIALGVKSYQKSKNR